MKIINKREVICMTCGNNAQLGDLFFLRVSKYNSEKFSKNKPRYDF